MSLHSKSVLNLNRLQVKQELLHTEEDLEDVNEEEEDLEDLNEEKEETIDPLADEDDDENDLDIDFNLNPDEEDEEEVDPLNIDAEDDGIASNRDSTDALETSDIGMNSLHIDEVDDDVSNGIHVSASNSAQSNYKKKKTSNYNKFPKCPHCPYSTERKSSMTRHINNEHRLHVSIPNVPIPKDDDAAEEDEDDPTSNDPTYMSTGLPFASAASGCPYCPFHTARQSSMTRHVNREHGKGPNMPTKRKATHATEPDAKKSKLELNQLPNIKKEPGLINQRDSAVKSDKAPPSQMKQRAVHKCGQCDFKSHHEANVARHVRQRHLGLTKQCGWCDFTTAQASNLRKHEEAHHNDKGFADGGRLLACRRCSFRTAYPFSLKRHLAITSHGTAPPKQPTVQRMEEPKPSSPKVIQCPSCSFKTASALRMQSHKRGVHPRDHRCASCDYVATQSCNLQRHIRSVHKEIEDIKKDVKPKSDDELQCPNCAFRGEDKVKLREHRRKEHMNLFHCNRCGYYTTQSSNLTRHVRAVHKGADDDNIKNVHKENIKQNIATREDIKPKLTAGSKPSDQPQNSHLRRHVRLVHSGAKADDQQGNNIPIKGTMKPTVTAPTRPSDQHQCSQCAFRGTDGTHLRKHVRRVHLDKFRCGHCGYFTTQNSHLRRHVRLVHKGVEKKVDNTTVDKKPSNPTTKGAENKATTRQFQCGLCGYSTSQYSHLRSHVSLVHKELEEEDASTTIKRPDSRPVDELQCESCDFRGTGAIKLRKHVRDVHTVRRHRCRHCSYVAKQNSNLKRHTMLRHKDGDDGDDIDEDISTDDEDEKENHDANKEAMMPTKPDRDGVVARVIRTADGRFGCSECSFTSKYDANVKR